MENNFIKRLSLILIVIPIFLNILPLVFATGITEVDNFYDMSNQPLTNVRNVFYHCSGAYINPQGEMRCTSVGSLLYDLNSGASNSMIFQYPYNPLSTASNPDYYAQYVFKDCYIPHDYIKYVWGQGATLNFDYNFYKVKSCHSPIDSFSITNTNYANEPVIINMNVVAEADAKGAFKDYNNGEVWYPPFGDYTTETKITFSVRDNLGNLAYIQSKIVNISWDSSMNVQFSWTPLIQGNYTAKMETEVIDCQCESNFKESSEKEFLVWPARPKDECYTILNDLEASPNPATSGNPIMISFNKISNYADNLFAKTATPTNISYEIKEGTILVSSGNLLISANSNTNDYQKITLPWTPSQGGNYNIKITGIAQSPLCLGKTNPVDTAILGIFVSDIPQYNIQFNIKDISGNPINQTTVILDSLTGNTDSSGNVNFKINPGTYNWQVSKAGYISQTGSTIVNANKTISIILASSIIPGTFPPILSIPTQNLLKNSGYNDNILNLKSYTTDADTPINNIIYSIISQSNITLLNCSIDVNKYLDCNVKNDTIGFSQITVSASDGTNSNLNSFFVYIGTFINGTTVELLYPIGEEKLSKSINISWIALNSENNALAISLYYSTNNGTTWNVIKENESNYGNYTWNTKAYPNGKYLLRIKAVDIIYGTTVYDQTQKEFSIFNSAGTKSSSDKEKIIEICEPVWECSSWTDCSNGIQTRICTDINFCKNYFEKTSEVRSCGDTERIILELKTLEKVSLFKKIFIWILPIGLILVSIGIIFALILFRKK